MIFQRLKKKCAKCEDNPVDTHDWVLLCCWYDSELKKNIFAYKCAKCGERKRVKTSTSVSE